MDCIAEADGIQLVRLIKLVKRFLSTMATATATATAWRGKLRGV